MCEIDFYTTAIISLIATQNEKPCGKIWYSFKVLSSLFQITHDGKTVNLKLKPIPYFTRLTKVDRVGVEPTTSASLF